MLHLLQLSDESLLDFGWLCAAILCAVGDTEHVLSWLLSVLY